ncbi:ABC transporter ATP-binding protein [Escherichia coli]|uniref:ABC transporter ATP-binding protein n=1 Tax=Escherichia coli TaxID=562 RepID=A0A377B881_ECOLX|nr:ABC transporter ATP-binding protein [Escherichia coli]
MIEFSHVSKLFGAQKAVNDLNLNFQEGSFSVLIGTSGSGKSTTLKMINRLVEHDSGEIRFAGEEIRSLPVLELRRRMAMPFNLLACSPTGAWRKHRYRCRNYKNGRGHGLTIVSTN